MGSSIKRIWEILRLFKRAYASYGKQFLIITVLGFLGGIAGGIGISSMIPVFSLLVHPNAPGSDAITKLTLKMLGVMRIPGTLPFLLSITVAVFILKAIFVLYANYINAKIAARYERETRERLLQNALRETWPHLTTHKIGYLERVILDDVDQSTTIIQYLSNVILTFTSLLMYVFVAITISLPITALTLILGGVIFIVSKPLLWRSRKLGQRMIDTNKSIAHFINESVLHAKFIKSLAVETKVGRTGGQVFRELADITVSLSTYNGIVSGLSEPVGLIFIALLFLFSYRSPVFNIGLFVAVVYLVQKIFNFVNILQSRFRSISQLAPSLRTILRYQREARQNREESRGGRPFQFKNTLRLENVSFAYPDSAEPILQNITHTIRRGTMVGIVGPSGAGKTTLVDMLIRLLEPTQGNIFLDDEKSTAINLRRWRKKIGYVSQDTFLINDTIENNIRFYDLKVTPALVIMAAKMAHCYDFIQNQPDKFNTAVGEQGIRLSGGQRQRIVLARILARQPKILILDEATNALDAESEAFIQKAINELRGKITIIIIAHRLSTVMTCDTVLVLKDGRIAEQGNPQELLKTPGSYFAQNYSAQHAIRKS